jgi:hypothetical protein
LARACPGPRAELTKAARLRLDSPTIDFALRMSGSLVIPDGSKRMCANFETYTSSGTPYWSPSETEITETEPRLPEADCPAVCCGSRTPNGRGRPRPPGAPPPPCNPRPRAGVLVAGPKHSRSQQRGAIARLLSTPLLPT